MYLLLGQSSSLEMYRLRIEEGAGNGSGRVASGMVHYYRRIVREAFAGIEECERPLVRWFREHPRAPRGDPGS